MKDFEAFQFGRSRRGSTATRLIALCCLFGAVSAVARADDVPISPWTKGFNNEARLLAGAAETAEGAKNFAGFEISMPPGWKTYWRTPGEAGGVPPEFDWSGSENLASAKVLYPAPHRLIDKAGATIGYKDRVLFPIEIKSADPSKPIVLRLKAAYGVCKEICIPAEAEISLEVPPVVTPSSEIADAIGTVPLSVPRADRDPTLARWSLETQSEKPRLLLEVADPAGASVDAFVEAPDGIFLPLPQPIGAKGTLALFEVDLGDADVRTLSGKALTVTLVGAKGQSETTIKLK